MLGAVAAAAVRRSGPQRSVRRIPKETAVEPRCWERSREQKLFYQLEQRKASSRQKVGAVARADVPRVVTIRAEPRDFLQLPAWGGAIGCGVRVTGRGPVAR